MTRKSEKLENLLIRIMATNDITEQSQILDKLKENGVDLPQSTLSRWLKKLDIHKVNNRYKVFERALVTRIPVFSIKVSLPNLVVLHTLPGHANALAEQIDQRMAKAAAHPADPYHGVLGTIAGDNTVLVIMKEQTSLIAFQQAYEGDTRMGG